LDGLLGPAMRLERLHTWRRPSGTHTDFAHVSSHASEATLPIRESLREILRNAPTLAAVFIATLRDGNVVLCLAPHEKGRSPAADPDHFSYVTIQRGATESDKEDFGQQKERFEVRLDTSYD